MWGLVTPAKTPVAIVQKLNTETNKLLADPATAKQFAELGVVVTPGTSEQFGAFIHAQTELWSAVVKAAAIVPD